MPEQDVDKTPHVAVVVVEPDGNHRAVCPACGWKAKEADYYRDKAWRRARSHRQAASRSTSAPIAKES